MSGNAIHPGEHLAEILDELEISASRLARAIDVPPRRINDIVRGRRVRYGGQRAPHRTSARHDAGVLAEPPADVDLDIARADADVGAIKPLVAAG